MSQCCNQWKGVCPVCSSGVLETELFHKFYNCGVWSGFRTRLLSYSVVRRREIGLLFSCPTRELLLDLCELLKNVMAERECRLGVL